MVMNQASPAWLCFAAIPQAVGFAADLSRPNRSRRQWSTAPRRCSASGICTFPMRLPTLTVAVMLRVMDLLEVIDIVYVMAGGGSGHS
jgi:hypothetical protein